MNKHHAWLHKEIGQWLREGLIDDVLADVLRRRYPSTGSNWGRFVLSGIGAVLFGMGVILIFAYNWEEMHKFTKLGVVFAALLGTHLAAIGVRAGGGPAFTSEGLHALGTMLFGAGIWLVAQIYHIEEHFPNAFLVWSIGALLLAWALPSLMQALMACALILIWQMLEAFSFENILHAALGLLLAGIFPLIWRLRSAVLAGFATLTLFASLLVNILEYDEVMGLVLLLAASAAVALSRVVAVRSPLQLEHAAGGFRLPGLVAYLALLYLFTFPDIADDLLGLRLADEAAAAYFSGAALVALLLWGAVLFETFSQALWRERMIDLAVSAGTVLALLSAVAGGGAWLIAIPFNLLFLFHAIFLIVKGGRSLRLNRVVIGCILLCILAAARYMDLFESLISRAVVFFIIGGALFAVANFYARNKQAAGETL